MQIPAEARLRPTEGDYNRAENSTGPLLLLLRVGHESSGVFGVSVYEY